MYIVKIHTQDPYHICNLMSDFVICTHGGILIYQGVHCCTKVCYLHGLAVRVVIPPESSGLEGGAKAQSYPDNIKENSDPINTK